MKITIDIDDQIIDELDYLVELYNRRMNMEKDDEYRLPDISREDLIVNVLCHVADGSRRPGSWERTLLKMMGLEVNLPEHQDYRPCYGKPKD